MKLTFSNAVVKNNVPISPDRNDTRIIIHHSFLVNFVVWKYANAKGRSIRAPIKCSKKIIEIGGREYRLRRITPSKAQSSAAIMINIGPEGLNLFGESDILKL